MSASVHFGTDYAEARSKFRAAVANAGLTFQSHVNAAVDGPNGDELTTDVVRIGAMDAPNILFLISATHGVEGFCGSGAQTAMLRGGLFDGLPADLAVVFIHAINPYGFAHLHRTTNVDLNRNFVDFDKPVPDSTKYEAIHPLVLPADWDGPAHASAEARIDDYIRAHGQSAWQEAVTSGQYARPDGLFYGGTAPTWSRRTLEAVVGEHAAKAERTGTIDFHTGLGPRGYGEPITEGTMEERARAKQWFGPDATDTSDGSSTSAELTGCNFEVHGTHAAHAESTGMVLEFGTQPVPDVLNALRADNWLRFKGQDREYLRPAVKKQIRDAFYGDDDKWREDIVERSFEMTRKALTALGWRGA